MLRVLRVLRVLHLGGFRLKGRSALLGCTSESEGRANLDLVMFLLA